MSSMTRLRLAVLPLLPGLALVACSEDATKPPGATAGEPPGAAGTMTTDGMPTDGMPVVGTPAGGAPTAGNPTEGNVMPGGIDDNEPPPTGVVECDESAIGGSAPNTLSVNVNTPAT